MVSVLLRAGLIRDLISLKSKRSTILQCRGGQKTIKSWRHPGPSAIAEVDLIRDLRVL